MMINARDGSSVALDYLRGRKLLLPLLLCHHVFQVDHARPLLVLE